jgi:hypothetical protein
MQHTAVLQHSTCTIRQARRAGGCRHEPAVATHALHIAGRCTIVPPNRAGCCAVLWHFRPQLSWLWFEHTGSSCASARQSRRVRRGAEQRVQHTLRLANARLLSDPAVLGRQISEPWA